MRVFSLRDMIPSSGIEEGRSLLHPLAFKTAMEHGIHKHTGKRIGDHRFSITRDVDGNPFLYVTRIR
jgi:hypothetical protein